MQFKHNHMHSYLGDSPIKFSGSYAYRIQLQYYYVVLGPIEFIGVYSWIRINEITISGENNWKFDENKYWLQ